jgi:hypothetical protein
MRVNTKRARRERCGSGMQTYVHGVAAGGLLARVALSQSPEDGVGQGVLAEVGKKGLVDLEGREVGCTYISRWPHVAARCGR